MGTCKVSNTYSFFNLHVDVSSAFHGTWISGINFGVATAVLPSS
jgi:hypothetical protein